MNRHYNTICNTWEVVQFDFDGTQQMYKRSNLTGYCLDDLTGKRISETEFKKGLRMYERNTRF